MLRATLWWKLSIRSGWVFDGELACSDFELIWGVIFLFICLLKLKRVSARVRRRDFGFFKISLKVRGLLRIELPIKFYNFLENPDLRSDYGQIMVISFSDFFLLFSWFSVWFQLLQFFSCGPVNFFRVTPFVFSHCFWGDWMVMSQKSTPLTRNNKTIS